MVKCGEGVVIVYCVSSRLFVNNHNEVKLGVTLKCSVILHMHLITIIIIILIIIIITIANSRFCKTRLDYSLLKIMYNIKEIICRTLKNLNILGRTRPVSHSSPAEASSISCPSSV